ncbi:MAG: peptidoglycan DD-metalloendopeptidase family protein [Acidimicrobiales bacterium]
MPAGRRAAGRVVPVVVALAVAVAVLVSPGAVAAQAEHAEQAEQAEPSGPVTYVPPVDAAIADPFRPPAGPFGPGNRGLEYDTDPGDAVRASADGSVVFAGPVAGTLHVTVLHADGVRTSYSFLDRVDVVLGQRVRRGDQVGTAGEMLHFGARAGDAYFDPAALFAGGTVEVELLPFEVPPGSSPQAEARALVALALSDHGGLGLPGFGDALGWLHERAASSLGYVGQLYLPQRGIDLMTDLGERLLFPGPCSGGEPPRAPVRDPSRVAVTVAGLGSSSDDGSIDELRTGDLGYDDGRVVRFSYAGGRAPGSGSAFDGLATTSYQSADTQGDLREAARRLADLVEQVAAADPGATIDVFAHSLGGVVTRLALLELADRGVALDRLGVVTTLGSPHRGADLATAVGAANTTLTGNLGLDAAEAVLDTGIDPDAEAVRQLAEHSDMIRGLGARGVPEGVDLVSIAARGDVVVASPNTEVAGATNVTVPITGWSAHGDLVASDAATAEMARALAGQPPGCEGWRDVVADVTAGHGISLVEDLGGAAALAHLR